MWFLFAVAAGAFGALALFKKDQEKPAPTPSQPAVAVTSIGLRARGDDPSPTSRDLPSPLKNVSDAAWTRFVTAMRSAKLGDVSPSNALGIFEIMPRRLADLGILVNTRRVKSPVSGRTVVVGEFVAPLTEAAFLTCPVAQYNAFRDSVKDYAARIDRGELAVPAGLTKSGALAVLQRCGPSGLSTWEDEKRRFPATVAVVKRANEVF